MSKFNRGKLRHKIRIEEFVNVLDVDGNVVQDQATGEVSKVWQLVSDPWAAIEPLSAREFVAAAAIKSKITSRITIAYRPGINAGMRVVHNGKIFDVHGAIQDMDTGLEWLTLPCSDGVNPAGQ